jgi:hypothetical protein
MVRLALSLGALLIAALLPSGAEAASSVSVSDKIVFAAAAGEAQSTIVPPGVKKECPAGRLFVSNDFMVKRTPIAAGAVLGRDLDKLTSPDLLRATFGPMPNAEYFSSGTDHDLVALPNGDLFLVDMTSSKAPLEPKPLWFDDTFRDDEKAGDFGPGARTIVVVWKSVDCGATFNFASLIETAGIGDGSCAGPQRADWNKEAHHPLDMGGSDGIHARVSMKGDRIAIINQCVGYKPDPKVRDKFVLTKERLNKSVVVESSDGGLTWKYLGMFPKAEWRRSFVDKPNLVAFAVGTGIAFGKRQPGSDELAYDSDGAFVPDLVRGSVDTPEAKELNATYGNLWAHPILTRTPHGDSFILTVPSQIKRPSGAVNGGYRVFLFNPDTKNFSELAPVAPQTDGPGNYIMHLAAIDIGKGPVMLYWSEFDIATKTGKVRGRLILNATEASADFVVSRLGGQDSTWALVPNKHYWYGDYQTAWGFEEALPAGSKSAERTFQYFPMWIEANRTVGIAQVTIVAPAQNVAIGSFVGAGAPQITPIPTPNLPARIRKIAEEPDETANADKDEEPDEDDDKMDAK